MVHAMSACSVRSFAVMPGQTATSICSSKSSQGRTLLDLIALEQDLEELLGRRVDG